MALEFDKEYYKKDDNGQMVLDYVVRPSINNNNLGPLPVGRNIKVKIMKNGQLVVVFQYDVVKQSPAGKKLMAAAIFQLSEQSNTTVARQMGQIITCMDEQVYEKVGRQYVVSYIDRPRNVRRDNLGPFVVGDVIRIEFLLNDNVLDSFDYTPSSRLPQGKVLMGLGRLDFVEMA